MTLAELAWIKERGRLFGRPLFDPEPERTPEPEQVPEQAPTFDLYGDIIIARMEQPT
jgi:hypothetical protein